MSVPPLRPNGYVSISTDIIYELAEISDMDFIAELSGDLFGIYGHYEEVVPNWFMSDMTFTVTARSGDKPIGFAMLGAPVNRYDLTDASELLAIAVDLKHQRKGVGGRLLAEIDAKAADFNIRRLFLHTALDNTNARTLFSRAGYRPWEVKKGFYPNGQDAIVMSKSIVNFGA